MLNADLAQTLLVVMNMVFLVPLTVLSSAAIVVTFSRLVSLVRNRKPSQPAFC